MKRIFFLYFLQQKESSKEVAFWNPCGVCLACRLEELVQTVGGAQETVARLVGRSPDMKLVGFCTDTNGDACISSCSSNAIEDEEFSFQWKSKSRKKHLKFRQFQPKQ